MTNRSEMHLQNHVPEQEATENINAKVAEQIKEDLRDLFRSAENPIAILLQTMETEEFKKKITDEIVNPIKTKLQALTFENEDDFVTKTITVAMPIFEIIKRGKRDAYKQEGREMFTETDMDVAIATIKENSIEKIYVVGNIGSGKTTFARELSRATNYKNIDIDRYFQIFRQEEGREAADLKNLLEYILQKERPPFIINHADLLKQDLIKDADLIVYLNPREEEQLKSRQLRTEAGAEGEWQAVSPDDYTKLIEQDMKKLENLDGKIIYNNEKSGTSIKLLKR